MKKMKRLFGLLLALAMLLTLAACGGKEEPKTEQKEDTQTEAPATNDDDVIVIGSYQPLSGSNALQGNGAKQSIDLYVKELNARGGLLGKQVKVVYYDDMSDPEEAIKCVTKLLEVDKIDICIGSIISSCLLSSGEALNVAKIPTYGLGLSPTWMAEGWEYFFRPTLNTDYSIITLTDTMKKMGYESVAIFEGQDDYGVAAGKAMRAACEKDGIKVTTTENYVAGDTDFSGQIAKILNTKPDCIFVGAFPADAANVFRQMRQFGYEGAIFYSETVTSDVAAVAGEYVNHVIYKFPYVAYQKPEDCPNEYMREFLKKYQAEYGSMPVGNTEYRAWDAMTVLEKAVNAAGTIEGEAVKNATLQIKDMQALAGTFDFTREGNGECLYDFASWVFVNETSTDLEGWFGSDDHTAFVAAQG